MKNRMKMLAGILVTIGLLATGGAQASTSTANVGITGTVAATCTLNTTSIALGTVVAGTASYGNGFAPFTATINCTNGAP